MSEMLDEALDVQPSGAQIGNRWIIYTGDLPVDAIGAVCAVTGKPPSPGARFVDLGLSYEMETPFGVPVICEDHLIDIGLALGLVKPDVLAAAEAEHHAALLAAHEVITGLEAEVAELRAAGVSTVHEVIERVAARLEAKQDELLELATKPKPVGRKAPVKKNDDDPQEVTP